MQAGTKEVEGFISRFTDNGKRLEVIDAFTNGCCYWFAVSLLIRFQHENVDIMYAQVDNHFGCLINGAVYDITGDVTDKYNWERWYDLDDGSLVARLYRDCINF